MKYILIMLLAASCTSNFNKEIVIVPDDYEGFVYIFYGQEYEKGKVQGKNKDILFFVPEDGVIFTKYSRNRSVSSEVVTSDYYKNKISKNEIEGADLGYGIIFIPEEVEYSQYYIGHLSSEVIDTLIQSQHRYSDIENAYKKYRNKNK